jgi:hypothetical protein
LNPNPNGNWSIKLFSKNMAVHVKKSLYLKRSTKQNAKKGFNRKREKNFKGGCKGERREKEGKNLVGLKLLLY